jgi:hypothetical protein
MTLIDERTDTEQIRRAITCLADAAQAAYDEDYRTAVLVVDSFADQVFPQFDDDGDPLWSSAARLRLTSLACLALIVLPPHVTIASLVELRSGHVDTVDLCIGMLHLGPDVQVLRDRMLAADDAFQALCGTRKMLDAIDAMVDERLAALDSLARA